MRGFVNSFEPFGTVDGPGIRLVAFLTGCPLKCSFCHNPEIAWGREGHWLTAEEVLGEFNKNKFFYTNGGITFSGGEPLVQGAFVNECAQIFKEKGVHVAVDTSLSCGDAWISSLAENVDLWMVSIKAITPKLHLDLTGKDNGPILARLRELNSQGAKMVIRYVIIPGLTDTPEELTKLGKFLQSLPHKPALELLAYHTMGKTKWEEMGLTYALANPDASPEDVQRAEDFLAELDSRVFIKQAM